jgi:PPIC-type PPIASE domain
MLRSLVKEPLFHFLVLGLLIFAVYTAVSGSFAPPDQIIVSQGKVEQLAALFTKTWQRPPTGDELKGLIDDYVKEEVYYREALELNLERDDPIVRRRLRLKMEAMDGSETIPVPDDIQLAAYLRSSPQEFAIPSEISFDQIYLNPAKRGAALEADVRRIKAQLTAAGTALPEGDATLLPASISLMSLDEIARQFGAEFTKAVVALPNGEWGGPIRSEYGLHFVRILERRARRVPTLEEARDLVVRKWQASKRAEIKQKRFEELLNRYEVRIETKAK